MIGDPHHNTHVVLDQENADAVAIADRDQKLVELGGLTRVEAGCRFVEAEQAGASAHGARDLEAALVSIREIARRVVGPIDEADLLQPGLRQLDGGLFGAIFRDKRTRAEEAAIERRSYELLHYVGVASRANDLAKHLAYGDQRRLEIARALATEPKLLALDEPAAGMNATETQGLKRLLEDIRRDGTTILLIEHDMKLVMSVCDRVLVLDYGRKIAEGTAAAVQNDPKVIAASLGGEIKLEFVRK